MMYLFKDSQFTPPYYVTKNLHMLISNYPGFLSKCTQLKVVKIKDPDRRLTPEELKREL